MPIGHCQRVGRKASIADCRQQVALEKKTQEILPHLFRKIQRTKIVFLYNTVDQKHVSWLF